MSSYYLPPEILSRIVDYAEEDRSTLASLCRTSQILRSECTSRLYREFDLPEIYWSEFSEWGSGCPPFWRLPALLLTLLKAPRLGAYFKSIKARSWFFHRSMDSLTMDTMSIEYLD